PVWLSVYDQDSLFGAVPRTFLHRCHVRLVCQGESGLSRVENKRERITLPRCRRKPGSGVRTERTNPGRPFGLPGLGNEKLLLWCDHRLRSLELLAALIDSGDHAGPV